KSLGQEFDLLLRQFQCLEDHSGDVAARSRKARHITTCNRIKVNRNKYDRNEGTRADDGLQCDFWTKRNNQVWVWPHKLHCIDEWTARLVQAAIVDDQVLLFGEAEVAQLSEERAV